MLTSKVLQHLNRTRGLIVNNRYLSQLSLKSKKETVRMTGAKPLRLMFDGICQRSYHNSCRCYFGITNSEVCQFRVEEKLSHRGSFQAIPVNQTVLNYIKTIGVGLRPRKNKKRFGSSGTKDRDVLSLSGERAFFEARGENRVSRRGANQDSLSSSILPPPPFSESLREFFAYIQKMPNCFSLFIYFFTN